MGTAKLHQPLRQQPIVSPGERIQAQPWAFVGVALFAGLALGALLQFRGLRKALRLYLMVRRFI